MVAYSHHPVVNFCRRAHRYWWQLGRCSIYLHTFLRPAVQAQDRYKTILVIVTGLLTLSLVFQLIWLMKVTLLIGVVAIFIPTAAKGIEWVWLKLATLLGWINSRILLSVVYFLFLMPLAWVSRLFTKDPLLLRKRKTASLFVTRNHLYTKKDLENIW
jgi:hypothetical protein